MIQVKEYVKFITDNKLKQEEFLMLYLLYLAEYIDTSYYKQMKQYSDEFGVINEVTLKKSMTSEETKQSLIDRGWLVKVDRPPGYSVSEMFSKHFATEYHLGNEFFDAYPGYAKINGINTPIKSFAREEAYPTYAKAIGYNISEHKEVLLDIEYGKANGLIIMRVDRFILAHYWKDIRKLRIENTRKQVNNRSFVNDNNL